MYPTYWLEVFDSVQDKWIENASYPKGDHPHHYQQVLWPAFERLVGAAKERSESARPIGYRIMRQFSGGKPHMTDEWTSLGFPR